MDESGIETLILSLNAPAVQSILKVSDANEIAQRSNDLLAEQIIKEPIRYRGFAALPMQDPELACKELERCINELGFLGALVNGFSQVEDFETAVYYDLAQYRPSNLGFRFTSIPGTQFRA